MYAAIVLIIESIKKNSWDHSHAPS